MVGAENRGVISVQRYVYYIVYAIDTAACRNLTKFSNSGNTTLKNVSRVSACRLV